MVYKTRQRNEILRFFEENPDGCFSAREVAARVSAGESTVFRTISALVKENLVRKFVSGGRGTEATYQYNDAKDCGGHLHLKCETCGRLIHMDCAFLEEMTRHFRDDHQFVLDRERTVLYGRCASCLARQEAGSVADPGKEDGAKGLAVPGGKADAGKKRAAEEGRG